MHSAANLDDYDKIMLSFKEKRILHRILKKKEVPDSFCNDMQKDIFFKHGLIRFQQKQIITSSGRVVLDSSAPRRIQITDKAFRYFLYRKEAYFKGKLPVVISLAALVISIANFICLWVL